MLVPARLKSLAFRYLRPAWRHLPRSVRFRVTRGIYKYTPAVMQELRDGLARRLGAGPGPSFWFLPTLTWYSNGFQRPHQMARALAEVGCPVLYPEPWVIEPWHTTHEAKAERDFFGFRDLGSRLHLLHVPMGVLMELVAEHQPDCAIMVWPQQAMYLGSENTCMVAYELIDDHSLADWADETFHANHKKWLRQADVVAASADDLYKQLVPVRPDALLLPNACRPEDWVVPAGAAVPDDLAVARQAPVVVGYYGALAEWYDWDLWEAVARLRPEWSYVIVGFPYRGDYEAILKRVNRHPNMYYLGAKNYKDLPAYLAHFDVATIPFVLNAITHACSPVKLFEYLAGGKPVVTTPMREVLKYKSVLTADTPEGFVGRLEEALRLRDDPGYRAAQKAEVEGNTWRSRAEALVEAVGRVRAEQGNVCRRHWRGRNAPAAPGGNAGHGG